ncbi:hypothetical protein ACFQ0B_36120 [Nonomuraea thailandensis]
MARRHRRRPGRLRLHALTTAAGLAAVLLGTAAVAARPGARVAAWGAGAAWAALTVDFAWRRIAPGPRTPQEVLRMAVTSVLIPPVACAHRIRGEWRVRR